MLSTLQFLGVTALVVQSGEALKLSPAGWLGKSPAAWIAKRQGTPNAPAPQSTTLTANFEYPSGPADTCSCTLVSAYTPFVTITSTYTASNSGDGVSTTTLAYQSGSIPGTVEIITPVSFTTVTSYYNPADGTANVVPTTTIARPSGTAPGTVIVAQPGPYVTVTSYDNSFTGTSTSTVNTYTGGTQPGTIIVDEPASYVTITSYDTSFTGTTTSTISTYTGGTQPGTIIVDQPASYVTITSYDNSFTGTSTSTVNTYTGGTQPGTIIIDQPASYVTITSYDNSFTGTSTSTINTYTGGNQPGTIIVDEPASYQTVTTYADVPSVTTVTSATYTGGTVPGTIVVESPGVYVTTTLYDLSSGVPPSTTTLSTYTGGTAPGTVQVESPGVYTTSTSYWGSSTSTTTTISTYTGNSGTTTNTGTVLVIIPASNAPVATSPTASVISRYTAPATNEPPTVPTNQPTSPVSSTLPAPTDCNNQGLAWAEYTNVNGDWSRPGPNNDPPGYINFNPESYKMLQPNYMGITTNIGGFNYTPTSQGTIVIYGNTTVPSDYWVVNHQAYIYPGQSGVYNFTSIAADDIVLVWVGPLAYSGWTRANAGLEQVYNDPPQGFSGYPGEPPVSFTVDLQQGQYYPIRVLYANAQRQAQFHLIITAPDGTQFLGPDTMASPYIVQYSCDGTTAPMFPAFGNQS